MKKKQYILIFFIAIVPVLLGGQWWYQAAKVELEHNALLAHEKKLSSDIIAIISDGFDAATILAITLSAHPKASEILCKTCPPTESSFSHLLTQLNLHTYFKETWIQLIDVHGVSLWRSWTDKKNDSLLEVRPELVEILASPRVSNSLSVGKFTMSFKSSAPVFDAQGDLQGVLEVVSPFGRLTKRLHQTHGVDSVILVDQKYRTGLTKAVTGQFIEDFYVVNSDALASQQVLLAEMGSAAFTGFEEYMIQGTNVIGRHVIYDTHYQAIGYWFTFESLENIDFSEVERVLEQYLYGLTLFTILVLMLLVLYNQKVKSECRQRYNRQIIDSASEIIFVATHDGIVDVNQHFLNFFSEYESLEEFLNEQDHISSVFEEEEGCLQESVNGLFWLDYVLQHPEIVHKVKIKKQEQPYYFTVQAKMMQGVHDALCNVLLQDITEQELYKQQLERISQADPLTGVGNRLFFTENFTKEFQRALRYHSNLSLVMLDIDFFKKVNDTYGHDVGDQVLITLVKEIQSSLRETDLLCRFGGEEFMIILPETGEIEAQLIAERLRVAVEALSFGESPIHITVSFGVGQMVEGESEKMFLKRIDTALYRAKSLGRNRVELAMKEGA